MNRPADSLKTLDEAVELHRAGRLGEAESAYRDIIIGNPRNADALHLLGILLHQAGHPEHTVDPVVRAIALEPGRPQFHSTLGRALFAMSHLRDALQPMRRATELEPGSSVAWADLGAVLQELGERDEASEAYRRAVSLDAGNATARFNLAILTKEGGDLTRAIALMEQLLRDAPDAARVHTVLAGYLLEANRVNDAGEHCRRALALSPRDLMAMTFASVACLRRGDLDAARRWVDLERLIHVETLAVPPGYESLAAFNSALEEHVLAHPTLEHERDQNATRNGSHTDNLLRDPEPGPLSVLASCLDDAVTRYLRQLPADPSHPFLALRPEAWRLQAWAVVMNSQGHQLAHTHPDGWVSGVYYPRIPQDVREADPQQRGWIEFGRPLPPLLGNSVPDVRRIRPEEGKLVLFPSYFYHETVPFDADTHRISIAFDAVPRWSS